MQKISVQPRLRGGMWNARIRWYIDEGEGAKQKEKAVSLRTSSIVVRNQRIKVVKRNAEEIIELHLSGINWSAPWRNKDGQSKAIHFSLADGVEKWLSQRSSEGIRPSTIKRNRYSLKSFMSFIGATTPLKKVSTSMIDSYRNDCIHKEMKPDGININLRAIKTFFNWCYRRELIEKNLFVDMVSKPKELPLYIPDSLFDRLMELDWLDDQYKTAFAFYRDTGCRRCEPFLGELHGNWLLIGGDETKQRMDKELELNHINLERLTSMRTYFNESYGYKLDSWIGNLSKTFLKAMREVDGHDTRYHLHCLRHTFAVRRYLQTDNIYLVKQELGHQSVVTTEIYAKFSLRRLESDFPSLVNSTKNSEIRDLGHNYKGHTSSGVSLSPIISGVSTS